MDEFETELKNSFLEEAEQAIADVEHAFIELENDPNNSGLLDKIFRLAHNLKGSSKAVGFSEMGDFTHHLESFLLHLKEGRLDVTSDVASLLLKCSDQINVMIQELIKDFDAKFDCSELIAAISDYTEENASLSIVLPDEAEEGVGELANEEEVEFEPNLELLAELGVIEEPVDKVEAPPVEAELEQKDSTPVGSFENVEANSDDEISVEDVVNNIQLPQKTEQERVADMKFTEPATPQGGSGGGNSNKEKRSEESIRISLSRLETLVNYVGEMSILQAVLQEQAADTSPIMHRTVHQMGKVMKEVQDLSMSLRMVPIKPVFLKMQRIVRDTSRLLDKNVKMRIVGDDTEVDKTVLEKIGDPLVHLVRNSVDHGIEADRAKNGKEDNGCVSLKAFHQGGRLVIEVGDDGAGLCPSTLRAKAIAKGIVAEDSKLTEQDCFNLIFQPGFSTKEEVTDISGRGVGMDVVKTNIESMNGEIAVESELGRGTTFRISLPLTLAIIDAMIVSVGENRFILPLSHVLESVSPDAKDIKHTTGIGDILLLRGESIPLFRMSRLLKVKSEKDDSDSDLSVIVARIGGATAAVAVDDIVGQSQVVIKQLGPEAQNFKGISATTILGDGKPALILELSELISVNRTQPSHGRLAV